MLQLVLRLLLVVGVPLLVLCILFWPKKNPETKETKEDVK